VRPVERVTQPTVEPDPEHQVMPGPRRRFLDRPWLVAGLFALCFGLLIAVLTPPLTGADERDHFTRAFQLSGGSVLTTKHGGYYGAYLPTSFAEQTEELARATCCDPSHTAYLHLLGAPTPTGPTVFVSLGNAASYGPGAYAAYAPAIAFGRRLGLSTAELLYLARFAGVLAYAALLTLAVRRLPVHRWVLVAGGLVPAALNQASTVSADGLTMVLSFLVVAEALYLSTTTEKIRGSLVEVGVAVVLLALAKPPYVVLAGLLVIPMWRRRCRVAATLAGILAVGAVSALTWGSYQSSHSLVQDIPGMFLTQAGDQFAFHHIDIARQTHLVLTQPWVFVAALTRSLDHAGLSTLHQLFGLLGIYQEAWWLVLLALATLLFSSVVNEAESPTRLDPVLRTGILLGVVMVFLVVYVIAYTNWNAYHAPIIEEVPTRYFLPLIPWLLIGMLPSALHVDALERRLNLRLLLTLLLGAVLTASVISLWHFHYTGPALI
jgi:uncharacterized membrane protein